MLNSIDKLQFEIAKLRQEQAAVRQQLQATLAELYPPLGELVRAQLDYSFSALRADLMLTASLQAVDSTDAYQQRIDLSTALEMLYLALRIHKLLLPGHETNGNPRPNRSWIGTVILTGDYCFSRAALLAAQTNEPQVVEIFARTLKTVNEGLLRRLFSSVPLTFDEDAELMGGGLRAAAVLADNLPDIVPATVDFALQLIKAEQRSATPAKPMPFSSELQKLAASQYLRWQALWQIHTISTQPENSPKV